MLNHGVADDNVHYQHSMLLTRALEENDIQFVQHSYPDENHSLGGVSRQDFLYFFIDKLTQLWSTFFLDFFITPWIPFGRIVSKISGTCWMDTALLQLLFT